MSIKPRTIDNLGIESSIRYARDKSTVDAQLIEDSKWIPTKTEISVTKPYVPSEFDQLFSPGPAIRWALFREPPRFEESMRSLFSHQLVPSLGSAEKQEADAEKLAALEDALNKREKKKGDQDQQQKDEKERQALLALLKCIEALDRTLSMINSRRNQYQRG